MRNICLKISYDGTRYNGFQIQPGVPTIQEELMRAITSVTGEEISVIGSGRTDAGVHARGQVVNFRTESHIPVDRWCQALNAHLPKDIVVWSASEVSMEFHARKSSKRKTYCYTINGNRYPDPMEKHMELHHPGKLNVHEMASAAQYLVGTHDFTSFCSIHTETESKVRTIYEAKLAAERIPGMEDIQGIGRIRLFITGNGFLYHMVRIIAGTLIEVGEGKRAASDIPRMIEARDRTLAGPTAKAHGLTLWDVLYE